jgi:catechol 2,3-dioxygenase-like lactoylglutathione lyase family enzyme
MEHEVGALLNEYEAGRFSRRALITHLAALAAAGAVGSPLAAAQKTDAPTFKATSLNHIALRVTNVQRSRDFYLRHLGMTVSREGGTSCFMTCGDSFVALFRSSEPSMDHYCYSVENYDVTDAVAKLEAEGLSPDNPTGSGRVYFKDPDGLTVQLAAESHSP